MDYYRSNIAGGIVQPNPTDATNTLLNAAHDSYASSYWNMPYADNGLSPMKQIEGEFLLAAFRSSSLSAKRVSK